MLFIICSLLLAQKVDDPIWNTLIEARASRTTTALNKAFQGDMSRFSDRALRQYILTLGQNGIPDQLGTLKVFMRNKDTQADALFAYGEVDGAPLTPLLNLGEDLRSQNGRLFAEALAKLARPQDHARLTALWQNFNRGLKNDALFSFYRIANEALSNDVIERLNRSVSKNTDGYVYYLYRAKVKVKSGLYYKLLDGYRGDPQTLIYALRIEPETVTKPTLTLLEDFTSSNDWRVQVNALNALNKVAGASALELARRLLSDKNPNVQRTAAEVMVKARSSESNSALLKAANKLSPGIRAAIMRTADESQKSTFFPLVADWATASTPWEAMRYLTLEPYSGKPDAGKDLVDLATNGYTVQAGLALTALQAIGKLTPDLARAALRSKDPYKMAVVMRSLRNNKDQNTWPVPLSELQTLAAASYKEPDFQQAYIDTLSTMVDEKVFKLELAKLCIHPDHLVRLAALNATNEPNLDLRQLVLGKGNQHRVPRPVTALAARMISGATKHDWVLETTKGKITIELATEDAPITCANIVYLNGRRAFQGLPLHRVVPNFVVQGGDSRGDGSGGPGYAIPCEINNLRFEKGTVGMALSGKDTGGSQFFICHSDQPHLDGGYTVFGKVTKGMRVVEKLEEGDVITRTSIE